MSKFLTALGAFFRKHWKLILAIVGVWAVISFVSKTGSKIANFAKKLNPLYWVMKLFGIESSDEKAAREAAEAEAAAIRQQGVDAALADPNLKQRRRALASQYLGLRRANNTLKIKINEDISIKLLMATATVMLTDSGSKIIADRGAILDSSFRIRIANGVIYTVPNVYQDLSVMDENGFLRVRFPYQGKNHYYYISPFSISLV